MHTREYVHWNSTALTLIRLLVYVWFCIKSKLHRVFWVPGFRFMCMHMGAHWFRFYVNHNFSSARIRVHAHPGFNSNTGSSPRICVHVYPGSILIIGSSVRVRVLVHPFFYCDTDPTSRSYVAFFTVIHLRVLGARRSRFYLHFLFMCTHRCVGCTCTSRVHFGRIDSFAYVHQGHVFRQSSVRMLVYV